MGALPLGLPKGENLGSKFSLPSYLSLSLTLTHPNSCEVVSHPTSHHTWMKLYLKGEILGLVVLPGRVTGPQGQQPVSTGHSSASSFP